MRRILCSLWGDARWHPGPLRLLLGVLVYGGLILGMVSAAILFPSATTWVWGTIMLVAGAGFFLFVRPNS